MYETHFTDIFYFHFYHTNLAFVLQAVPVTSSECYNTDTLQKDAHSRQIIHLYIFAFDAYIKTQTLPTRG